ERDADPSVRQVIDQRPLLGDADRVVKLPHTTARPYLDVLGDGGDGGARHRGIRVESAKRMEMPFRRPDGFEPVPVCEPGALEPQAVLVAPLCALVAGEIEQAEPDGGVRVLEDRSARAQR